MFCQLHTPAALPPENREDTQCIRGWVGPRAILEGCERLAVYLDSIPRPLRPKRVAIPTDLYLPTHEIQESLNYLLSIIQPDFFVYTHLKQLSITEGVIRDNALLILQCNQLCNIKLCVNKQKTGRVKGESGRNLHVQVYVRTNIHTHMHTYTHTHTHTHTHVYIHT